MAKYTLASMPRWVARQKNLLNAVVRASAQDVLSEAQTPVAEGGRMPVDTGALRNSVAVEGAVNGKGVNAAVAAIAGMEAGDSITVSWGAIYAVPVEFGARGRPGRYFATSATDDWQRIVADNVRRLR